MVKESTETSRITLRFPRELIRKAKIKAAEREQPIGKLIEEALAAFLKVAR